MCCGDYLRSPWSLRSCRDRAYSPSSTFSASFLRESRRRRDLLHVASRIAFTEPNFRSSAFLRFGPTPAISSSAERMPVFERTSRWYVIANRCASSRMRCTRYSACDVAVEHDRLRNVRHVQLLEPLREARQRDLPDAEVAHCVVRRGHLALASVHDHEVRHRPERLVVLRRRSRRISVLARRMRPGPPSLIAGSGRPSSSVVGIATSVCSSRAASLRTRQKRRFSTSCIIAKSFCAAHALDPEAAVLAALRVAIDEHDHRAHRGRPLDVRDVVALDARRQRRQVQFVLQLLERLVASSSRPPSTSRAPAVSDSRALSIARCTSCFFSPRSGTITSTFVPRRSSVSHCWIRSGSSTVERQQHPRRDVRRRLVELLDEARAAPRRPARRPCRRAGRCPGR